MTVEVPIGIPVPAPTPTATGTATWPRLKRPDASATMPPARLMTVMILPPEPSRKSVNFVSAVLNVVSAPANAADAPRTITIAMIARPRRTPLIWPPFGIESADMLFPLGRRSGLLRHP